MKNLILIFLLICLLSCSKREWNNPYDPACPGNTWAPKDLSGEVQDGQYLMLHWNKTSDLLKGYRLRKTVENKDTVFLDLSKETATFLDRTITGGKNHHYTLVAFAGENESDQITLDIVPVIKATAKTFDPSSVTPNSMVVNGEITEDGGAEIEERGIYYGTTTNPIVGTKIGCGSGKGTFSATITGLLPSKKYYIYSYAINERGVSTGNLVSATTLKSVPVVVSLSVQHAYSFANLRYQIRSDGGSTMTASGTCWSRSHNPTITDNKVVWDPYYYTYDWTYNWGAGPLASGYTWYLRPYATNALGTGYGEEMSVTL